MGERGWEQVKPFFDAPFKGALTLFLLEMGIVAGARLGDLQRSAPFLLGFAVLMPIVHGALGVWLGHLAGLSVAGCTVLGAMAASASYIAAPPAVRVQLPRGEPDVLPHGVARHDVPVQHPVRDSHLLRDRPGDRPAEAPRHDGHAAASDEAHHGDRGVDDRAPHHRGPPRPGAAGFSVVEGRGEGTRHLHAGELPGANVRIETVTPAHVADRILGHLAERYFHDYSIIAYVTDVAVLRSDKYVAAQRSHPRYGGSHVQQW
jgi:hypothetical protein